MSRDDDHRTPESIAAEEASLDACRGDEELGLGVRPCPVPVKPGYGQAAYKAGCEDEWIDRMRSRYGGEW